MPCPLCGADPGMLAMIGQTHNMEKVRLRMRIAELEAENEAQRAILALADFKKNGGVPLEDLQKELEK